MAKILVTGAAGFIGYNTSERLLARGDAVVGLDNVNDYYDPTLKEARLARLARHPGFRLARLELGDREGVERLFREERFDRVIHLAAQAGVRYSITNPHTYIDSNLVGFLHILEGCRHHGVQHLTYASSSSVYGANTAMPFSVHQNIDHPVSLYAATKKANELMAHTYSHLYGLPTTGLRFSRCTDRGSPGHGHVPVHEGHSGRQAHRRVQPRQDAAGLHLHRRYRRRVVRTSDHVAAPNPDWNSDRPDPATSKARTEFTISVTTTRSN